ncbi:MAG: glycosyltransferase [Cyanobacteria bacterium RYN_339]|nr:glycosyltransferase [Cyanobacteria bacterium RYN_339]
MRIAVLAPIWERVPPPAYGGIETVVYLLVEGLVAAGHDVTLFATGDSRTSARLVAIVPRALREQVLPAHLCQPHEALQALACLERAAEFDVIHNHAGYLPLLGARGTPTPMLTTLHGAFNEHNRAFFAQCAGLPFVSISDAQRVGGPSLAYQATVYNGIDTDAYDLAPKGRYLLNLGRISPEKGTHLAIQVARRAGLPLVIAAKVDPCDQAYFEREVQPHLDGEQVRFVGEVGGAAKAAWLAGAVALVHPVTWPEPFGLVMAEAMAAGTPVLATPRGSVPEVVEPHVTGWIAEDVDALAAAVPRVAALDPSAIRRRAVERFGAGRMVAGYEQIYMQLAAGRPAAMVRPSA